MEPYDRTDAYAVYHDLYTEHSHTGSCYYCDGPPESVDHVPALAVLHKLRGFHEFATPLLVVCCRTCNSSLGDMPLVTPEERRKWIQTVGIPSRISAITERIQAAKEEVADLENELARLKQEWHPKAEVFSQLPIGARFRFANSASVVIKNSEHTYKIFDRTQIADTSAKVVEYDECGRPRTA